MNIAGDDLLWMAGWLEGEGCFTFCRQPAIQVSSTDYDVIERFGKIVGKIPKPIKVKKQHKPAWKVHITGKCSVAIMRLLLPLMGTRRQSKITEVLSRAEARPGNRKLTEKDVREIVAEVNNGWPYKVIAAAFGTSIGNIGDIISGKNWKHVTQTIASTAA